MTGEQRAVRLPEALDTAMIDAVDYPSEKMSDWMRGAIVIRLAMENDREFLEESKEELAIRLNDDTDGEQHTALDLGA